MRQMRKLSKLAVLGSAVAAGALVLAGCGSSASPTTTSTTVAAASGGTHMTRINGGTLTIAEAPAGGPNYIFPMMGGAYFSVANFQLIYMLYRPLYWFGLGNTPNLNAGLSVADPPVYSKSGTTVTIKLKGYKWSNGESVNAQDVIFWLNMLKANATSWAAFAPGPNQYPGDISNAVANDKTDTVTLMLDAKYSSYWFTYNELSQISPLPIAWDVTSPTAKPGSGGCSSASYSSVQTTISSNGTLSDTSANAKKCAAVYAFLTSKSEAGDLGTYASNPLWQVVDGPFRLSSYDATDNGASVVPNPKYSGPVKSSLNKLVLAPFTTDASEYLELEAGKTINIGYIPPQDLPVYKGSAFSKSGAPLAGRNAASLTKSYNLDPAYPWGVNYFALNYTNPTSGPIFKQLYVRQAMQSLMNQSLWIQLFNAGYGAPTYGPVPVDPPTDLASPQESVNPYPYDPQHAVSLLRSHGWDVVPGGTSSCVRPGTKSDECGAGIPLHAKMSFNYLYFNGATAFNSQQIELQQSWKQAGISLSLDGKSFGDVLTVAASPCTPGKACNWDIANWGGGWVYSPDIYPSGEEIFATGASQNFGQYSNTTDDKLIKLTNTSSSLQALYNYENYLAKQVPDIWQPETALEFNEVGKNVCGFTPQNPLFSWEAEYWYFCKASK